MTYGRGSAERVRLVARRETPNKVARQSRVGKEMTLGVKVLANMRMHLPKPRAPWTAAERVTSASSQVIRGR